jgi:hypothetical protein
MTHMPQFRVLYREFLFRMVDLELLSSRGDIHKLLAQVAAMLAALSCVFSLGALRFAYSDLSQNGLVTASWSVMHFLISTTMMVVGLFTIVCWDSTFPDRRDVLVLAPLPIRARTMFFAKVAALGTALGLAVLAINVCTGIAHPVVMGYRIGGAAGALRSTAAYWLTMYAAGAFLVCAVLAIQGIAAQVLSRARFLKVSGYLQLGAFALILGVYFLEPLLANPTALAAPEHQRLLRWLPTYWFLGLFESLNGTSHPALEPLSRRAWTGLTFVSTGALVAFMLSYFRTLRRIVEEPDIVPGAHAASWSPRFGNSLQTALVLFSSRTLLRSRQHRVILAGYAGVGFAIALAYCKSFLYGGSAVAHRWHQVNQPFLIASVVMMAFAVVGMRAVFSLPLELRANWLFRVTAVRETPHYLAAIRRSLLALAVAPVWIMSAVCFLSIWPLPIAAGHLLLLGLFGLIAADLWLYQFQKIPFTCSYLPGKANVHITSLAYLVVFLALAELGVQFEMLAFKNPVNYSKMLLVFVAAAVWARRRCASLTNSPEASLQFEEIQKPDISALDLHRDGKLVLDEAH